MVGRGIRETGCRVLFPAMRGQGVSAPAGLLGTGRQPEWSAQSRERNGRARDREMMLTTKMTTMIMDDRHTPNQ